MSGSALRLVELMPGLLGTYGDHGNLLVLAHRARARGLEVETLVVHPGTAVPQQVDAYLLGGGEDEAQATAARLLAADGGLAAGVGRGSVLLAICAGLQILGSVFPGPAGPTPGLDLVDLTTAGGVLPRRAVGELLVAPGPQVAGLPTLTGFENHAGATTLGPGVTPLGRVLAGFGNGVEAQGPVDGFVAGRVLGTYLHGPALARNPALADLVLGWAVGAPLAPLDDDTLAQDLHAEREAAARSPGPRRFPGSDAVRR